MACKLTRIPGGTFTARAGAKVEVDVRSDEPASTVRIIYAGDQDGEAPFEFTVKEGRHLLLVVALGVNNQQRMNVVEVDGEDDCQLKRFSWSTSRFHTTLPIEGE
jgi:hypothetical protein